ncbi:MAG: flagellar hook-associated protein FlgL [Candidatus Scalinduaceae bacterium]
MTTRVSLEMLTNATLANIQLSTSRMQKLQEQISTGKKVNRPSDNPADARKILNLNSEFTRLEKYSSNIQTSIQSLEFNASVLDNLANLVQRAQELTVQGVNGTMDQTGRNIIANEINQLLESALQDANSTRLGRYIFAGTEIATTPFEATRNSGGDISTVTYKGNREKIEYLVGPGIRVQVNQPGEEAFIDNKLFDTIIKIRDNLKSGAISFASAELDNIENAHNSILNLISKAGSVTSTLELTNNRIEDTKFSIKDVIGATESADISELILKLKEQENIFQASLASGALVFRTNILDFL